MDGLSEKELKTVGEICKEGYCGRCLLNSDGCMGTCLAGIIVMHKNIFKIKEACAKWEEGHRYTHLKEFKKRFPENTLPDKEVQHICRDRVFYNIHAGCTKKMECNECWNQEYKPSTPSQD